MSSKKQVSINTYSHLIASIRKEMIDAVKTIEHQKVMTYWNIGKFINQYLSHREHLEIQIGVFYEKLSTNLNISARTLQHSEQFYRSFPQIKMQDGLSWSHYRFLMTVPKEKDRSKWLAYAVKNKMSAANLRYELMESRSTINVMLDSAALKKPERGLPFIYRIVHMKNKYSKDNPWYVDCGFTTRIEAPADHGALNNKWLYRSEKTSSGYKLFSTDAKVGELYTFNAKVLRVVDGDTLIAAIDQGFGIWTEQRLRLKGIDAPEMSSLQGKKAKAFVESCLKGTSSVIVKTHKSDKYDRYLVDIFYIPKEKDLIRIAKEGRYLNQHIVSHGHAQVWK